MPMKAMFECDDCGKQSILKGNITRAVEHMENKGWVAGKNVRCPDCVLANAETTTPTPQASKAPAIVHSDGSCVGSNPGFGGWAWTTGSTNGSAPAADHPTTNQRMEIQAAVEALIHNADPVILYTDSRYVVDCINKKWYVGWLKNNWLTSAKQPVKNKDLWVQLVGALKKHPSLEVRWVKGHNGDPLNEEADVLARTAAELGRANRSK